MTGEGEIMTQSERKRISRRNENKIKRGKGKVI